jgi:hypothetical protein
MVRRAMLVAPTARAFCGVLCPQHRKIAVEQHSSRLAPQKALAVGATSMARRTINAG